MDASSMERISQWVASQEIPSDLTVRIGDAVFPLHKAVMVPKCGYIRRAVAAARKDGPYITELDLSSIPGGAAAFEKAALYCYAGAGATTTLDITASNAAPLLCAAAFLDIHQSSDGGGLVRRVEEFLAQTGLRSLQNAVAVLRSCERVGPAADELGVARRAADAVALKVCNEALFPSMTTRPAGWWAAELAALPPASFGKVVTALRCRHAAPEVVIAAAAAYAEITLAELLLLDPTTAATTTKEKKGGAGLLEAVVDVLPPSSEAPLPAALLCRLLHAAVTVVHAAATTCRDLELRVAAVLDQATADDLLAMALDAAGEHLTNTDTIRRVIAAFVERHHHHQEQQQQNSGTQSRNRRSSLCVERRGGGRGDDDDDDDSTSSGGSRSLMEKVARMVDEVAAELATEEELTVSKFVGVCGAVPRDARASHDYLYRAVDIYLKTHPGLDEIQREKVCSVMDPLRLSYQARLHASQNKRLPLQAVLTALYYDNLNLRSSSTTMITTTTPPPAIAVAAGKNNNKVDEQQHSLARENEALRLELAQMRAYLSAATAQQQQHNGAANSKGGSASSRAALPPAAKKKKATSFLSLGSVVTRTLSRLNPFKPGGYWAANKDTSSVSDGRYGNTIRDHVLKPKRRRFSIS